MATTYVKCMHTKGTRMQECILVLVADRMACIPIAPSQNAIGKLAAGLALTAVGVITFRIGERTVDVSQLATADELDAAVKSSGGFHVEADWLYRTGIPMMGTMIMRGNENLTTRDEFPREMLARLTPNRTPVSSKGVKIICAVGAAIIVAATIAFLATGSFNLLFGIGFWGVVIIGAALYAWLRLRNH